MSVGMDSWGGGTGADDFGAWYNLLVGAITLVVCLLARYLLKGVYKNLDILVGLVAGYIISIFNSLPQAVLGGCTVMMFGSIMYEGIKMLKECEFNDRTMIIVSLSFCIGVGLTQTSGNFFAAFPSAVGDIFNGNAVAGVFVVSLLLSLFLPKKNKK